MNIEYTKDGVKFGDIFITLDEIITKVNEAKILDESLVLLTMKWPERRGFDGIKETIIIPEKNVERFKEIICGKRIYFGEIAGKHSEIYGTLDIDEITINTNKDDINKFLSNFPNGHDCNHSFLDTFDNNASDGHYGDVDDEILTEFRQLY